MAHDDMAHTMASCNDRRVGAFTLTAARAASMSCARQVARFQGGDAGGLGASYFPLARLSGTRAACTREQRKIAPEPERGREITDGDYV